MRPPAAAEPPSGAPAAELSFYGATDTLPPTGIVSKRPTSLAGAQGMLKDKLNQLKATLHLGDAPALLVPCFLFAAVILPTSLMQSLLLGELALLLGIVLSLGFILLSRWRAWQLLAVTCLMSVALGWGMGSYDRSKYLYRYLVYERSPSHADVLPSSNPGGYRDAGHLTFSDDTHVDGTMGLGYRSGDLWCVAPITQGQFVTVPAQVGYWAVGKNCCRERGFFHCGDIGQNSISDQGGLVVMDLGSWADSDAQMYHQAARTAAETYGLTIPDRPLFVRWGTQPEEVLGSMFHDAQAFALLAVGLFALIVPIFVVTFSALGLALTGRKKCPGWHPDMVEEMTFGVNLYQQQYSDRLRLDLLHERSYWSGEVIYDYAFHAANSHMFLGCLFAHPAHPFSKAERILVACIVIPLIIFPVAACSASLGETGLARSLVVLIAVTVPRNLLKRYLVDISQTDDRFELEDGRRKGGVKAQGALQWEMAFIGMCFIITAVISGLCVKYVRDHVDGSTAEFIWRNCDGIFFAVIVEPLLGLLHPYTDDGGLHLGFFGRWMAERNHVEEDALAAESGTEKVGMSDM